MTLCEYPVEFQHKVIIRLWLALGIRAHELADDAVEDLLAEWQNELAGFTLEQIDQGRLAAAKLQGTLPADKFADLCRKVRAKAALAAQAERSTGLSDVAMRELERMRDLFEGPAEK